MYYRCELLVNGMAYDATNELVNWADVEMSFKRGDYDGVVRSFSTKFEFANGAFSLLLKEYLEQYLNSSATIVFYIRNNSWLLNEKFRCALDFSTFTYSNTTCEINAVDNSLASLIKSKKGTQYEYPVSELKDSTPLYYDRLEMTSHIEWLIPSQSDSSDIVYDFTASNGKDFYMVPLYIKGNPEIAVKNIIEVDDVEYEKITEKENELSVKNKFPYFFDNISARPLTVSVKCKFDIAHRLFVSELVLHKIDKSGNHTNVYNLSLPDRNPTVHTVDIDKTVTLEPGEKLSLFFHAVKTTTGGNVTVALSNMTIPMTIEFIARDKPIDVDVIKPVTLLNRLLRSINNDKEGVIGEIAVPDNPNLYIGINNALIVPAESIRGLEKAKVYTSYTKFANWMSAVFGFVPVIGENKVTFVPRDTLFQDREVKDLGDAVTDFSYNVDSSMVYSRVKVGYDKQDYDSVNGRDEFHFTNEYTTGVTLTDNVFEMISPYRADAYGIEFLAAKQGEKTTDSDSDNDVFFVGALLSDSKYKLIRWNVSGVISPSTMFNVMYAPFYMIDANKGFLAAFAQTLNFASSDGNSDVSFNGESVKDDFILGSRLFSVGELSVETGDLETLSDLSGYIRVEKNGHIYKGYVKSASYNYGRPEAVKYILIVKDVN